MNKMANWEHIMDTMEDDTIASGQAKHPNNKSLRKRLFSAVGKAIKVALIIIVVFKSIDYSIYLERARTERSITEALSDVVYNQTPIDIAHSILSVRFGPENVAVLPDDASKPGTQVIVVHAGSSMMFEILAGYVRFESGRPVAHHLTTHHGYP